MRELNFNDLRDLTPHPQSLSPLRGEGAAIGQRHNIFVLRHSNPLRFMGGEQVRTEQGTSHEALKWNLFLANLPLEDLSQTPIWHKLSP
jgi:hypothetical protein